MCKVKDILNELTVSEKNELFEELLVGFLKEDIGYIFEERHYDRYIEENLIEDTIEELAEDYSKSHNVVDLENLADWVRWQLYGTKPNEEVY